MTDNRDFLHFTDIQVSKDASKFFKKGHVKIFSKNSGKMIFEGIHYPQNKVNEGDNKVILPGSILAARKFFPKLVPNIVTPSYNEALGLDGIMSLTTTEEINSSVCLFALGNDGCGVENSQVYDVNYTKWISPNNLVPFKYQPSNNDLTATQRKLYHGRKNMNDTNRIAYFFKAFDNEPTMHIQYIDGTSMDENVYNTDITMGGEVYVEMNMSIEPTDCREFAKQTTGLNSANINSISLLTAYPKELNGYTYYQSIRPLTKYNFPTEPLIDEEKGFDIVYDLYF